MTLIVQPAQATIAAITGLINSGASRFEAAVAYATFSGARLLVDNVSMAGRPRIIKRFLVGIDWFRSEPSALDLLDDLPLTSVRVVDAEYLLSTETCQPRQTFHPKAYLVKEKPCALLVGSANLSLNGLQRSAELSLVTKAERKNNFDNF